MLIAAAVVLTAITLPPESVTVIPRPVSVTASAGPFTITSATVVSAAPAARRLAQQLVDYLAPATGWRLRLTSGAGAGSRAIVLRLDGSLAALGPEGYRLEVTPRRLTIRAPHEAGLFYGIQTLRQLLPAAIFREAPVDSVAWTVPAVVIEDQPRFSWRGAHLDAGRHFMPLTFIKKYLDLLALQKMNRFHWHLTEDQGWRLEIRRYPRLTAVGSCRSGTLIGRPLRDTTQQRYTTVPHCGFYTQDDVREIVAYAAARFITVVPEIEMPGHAQAAIAAYPELGVTGRAMEPWRGWGVSENILMPSDSTVAFFQRVLEEVLELFPSPWIHIGGDEATKTQWDSSAAVQERLRELNLRDMHELQSWFIRQMDRFLAERGRRLIGWDEILEGGLAPNATVMSWRGMAGGIAAARAGHDVVMAPTSHTYLDYYQTRDTATEALRIGGYLPLETVYAFEPVPPELTAAEARHILGTQGQLWSEYLPSPRDVEWQAFPRLTALAEVGWTPRDLRDFSDFQRRLWYFQRRLDVLDVNYYRVRGGR
jgi:hexosaminidase